ncbi:dihydrofolate reductase family protein [Tunicatimonas pelagia]|uniref:dihydrofolate reductase family protein n=1 Tax=Tunicatimonas pelagia TaxID=931531 RepID=UPI002666CCF1|nr:dihydrofolate reductase family protein [Tunicatimonas pelagia]WKN40748.1 dihydrofolate reductase family protein [Tunicatimonas pelagia]
MQSKIVYYVATSIDGFIAGSHNDISSFFYEGEGVEKYKSDLSGFDTVLMGRKTYEVGFKFGLKPGSKAYPGMRNYIFSEHLYLENCEEGVHVCSMDANLIKEIRKTSTKDIYLCGGGMLAAWLLQHGQVDEVRIKINPIILGTGVKLFSNLDRTWKLHLTNQESFDEGMTILSYDVIK